MIVKRATEAAQWRSEGWVLLEGLVPRDVITAARAELEGRRLDPPTNRGPLRRPNELDDSTTGKAGFREEQFAGTVLFPIPNAPLLNRLFVDPRIVGFAETALETTDLRIYQSRLWAKYGDWADYEQPLHQDTNHSLIPLRVEPGWWFMECFLYLDDVDEHNGAPRLVPRTRPLQDDDRSGVTEAQQSPDPPRPEAEVSAAGVAGSLLAYRSDVWHRGTDLDPEAERHVLVIAFKPAGLDWVGFDAHPPLVINVDFKVFAAASTPRELALFGIPEPGNDVWTSTMIRELGALYPGLDTEPWLSAVDPRR